MLITDDEIEVYSHETSGEVEYVLLVENEKTIYVGLGSDHTDRQLEKTDIPRSKQTCPNVMSNRVWLFSELEDHWDDLIIKSRTFKENEAIPYQEGRLDLILNPRNLMGFVVSKIQGPLDRTAIFSGTIGTLTGSFVFGNRFEAELIDPTLNRCLKLRYDILPLDDKYVD